MPCKRSDCNSSVLHVPESDSGVVRTGSECISVKTEGDRSYPAGVTDERVDEYSIVVVDVPNLDRGVI